MISEYGRYRIVKELGRGTMGVVYQAHDPQIDRMVALKVLRSDRVSSESFVARFLKEARAIGRLSDPHIVTIHDVGEDHGTVYIAMEYLQGEPFNQVIRSGRLTIPQSIDIARQVALTLDYAHRQGIVHRDIKPSNIILAEGNQVKLTDFGIARIEETGAGLQTQAGEILGTPVYMSPEQVKGERVDGRSDLFSLGVILYEMVAGRRPFTGNNIAAIFRAITQDTPENPVNADPFIPTSLSDLVMKSLAKQPSERFQSGRQMTDALDAAGLQAQPAVAQANMRQPAATPKAGMKTVLALALVFVLGLGGYLIFHQRAGDTARGTQGVPVHLEGMAGIQSDSIPSSSHGSGVPITFGQATLKISSDPQGAQIFVDREFKGVTPMDMSMSIGKYELRLNLPGYFEWEAQVELDVEGDTPLHIPLRPLE